MPLTECALAGAGAPEGDLGGYMQAAAGIAVTLASQGVREAVSLSARVVSFSAITLAAGVEQSFGATVSEDALPKAVRRRLSAYDLGVARCMLGLHDGDETIVFASRHGNMELMTALFEQLARQEILSPAKFSMSVHNAAMAAASQMTGNRAGHTAVGAGRRSLAAGFTEAWLRLRTGGDSVIVCYADRPLESVYTDCDEEGPAVYLAARLVLDEQSPGTVAGHEVADGRVGAEALARALASGERGLTWRA